jgi:hypothetical protein
MGGKLRDDFNSFIIGLERVQRQTPFYRSRIADLVAEKGNLHLNVSTRGGYLISEGGESPILLRYADGHERRSFSLIDCILFAKKPLDMMREQVSGFREEYLNIAYSINTPARETTRGRVVLPVEQRYSDYDDATDRILNDVREALASTGGYNEFNEDCVNLAKIGDSLSQRLTKYVEQYVQLVDI